MCDITHVTAAAKNFKEHPNNESRRTLVRVAEDYALRNNKEAANQILAKHQVEVRL